jgi:hypothetical protein
MYGNDHALAVVFHSCAGNRAELLTHCAHPSLLCCRSAIQKVQASLAQHSSALRGTFTEPSTAHLTMFVMLLDDGDKLAAAQSCLTGLRQQLAQAQLLQPLPLQLKGLSNFRNQVGGCCYCACMQYVCLHGLCLAPCTVQTANCML